MLHIAIVNQELELVKWLLEKGIDLGSRAEGAFFQPALLRSESREVPSRGKRVWSWIENRDLKNDPVVHTTANSDSACYYGEFPLSFAVSIGNISICKILNEHARSRIVNFDPYIAHQYDFLVSRNTNQAEMLKRFVAESGSRTHVDTSSPEELRSHAAFLGKQPINFFVHAQDTFGNTALHMAIMYQQKECVDWLVQVGGREGLDLMNDDGFTPLTLAGKTLPKLQLSFPKLRLSSFLTCLIWCWPSSPFPPVTPLFLCVCERARAREHKFV